MRCTLPYPPSANRYWRNVRGRTLKSREARRYAVECQWLARAESDGALLQGEVAVTLRLYRPSKRGDLDNRIKVVLDALQGVAYADDKQVIEIHAYRYDDKENPRIEIDVQKAGIE